MLLRVASIGAIVVAEGVVVVEAEVAETVGEVVVATVGVEVVAVAGVREEEEEVVAVAGVQEVEVAGEDGDPWGEVEAEAAGGLSGVTGADVDAESPMCTRSDLVLEVRIK